jgi:4'-phosphopantetheinyl transferase
VIPNQSAPPELGDEIHIWRARLDSTWPRAGGLPPTERERAACLLPPNSRRRWVAARWALRSVLARYLDRHPAEIELCFGERGKPMLDDPGASLRFNLSHSAEVALIAVARGREVGIDVQRFGARPADFYGEWTRREAIAKCHGVGLWAPLPAAAVAVSQIDAPAGFAAALAVSGERMPAPAHFLAEPFRGVSRSRPACGDPRWRPAAA